jgi:hypothetical protein
MEIFKKCYNEINNKIPKRQLINLQNENIDMSIYRIYNDLRVRNMVMNFMSPEIIDLLKKNKI